MSKARFSAWKEREGDSIARGGRSIEGGGNGKERKHVEKGSAGREGRMHAEIRETRSRKGKYREDFKKGSERHKERMHYEVRETRSRKGKYREDFKKGSERHKDRIH
jgi:hypothetical protein